MCILVDGVVYHGKVCVSSLAVSRWPIGCYEEDSKFHGASSESASRVRYISLANCREEAELRV